MVEEAKEEKEQNLGAAVHALLDIYSGNKTQVASLLHMSRNTIAGIAKEHKGKTVSVSSTSLQKILQLEKAITDLQKWRDAHIEYSNDFGKNIVGLVKKHEDAIGELKREIREQM